MNTRDQLDRQDSDFLALLSNPARNTLLNEGIDSIQKLATYTEKEILALHGMGKASLPVLRQALESAGLAFKKAGIARDKL